MLFELTNTSATFQELINHVLYNHLNEFIITYLNNILIYSENEKNHKNTRVMKSIFARSKISDNHQIKSQKFTILHDNKEVEQMTSMMSRNFNRV